jgi:hypothetical protein
MHLSTFAIRKLGVGSWVVDATSNAGVVRQLIGVFSKKAGATKWVADHPASWFAPLKSTEVLKLVTAVHGSEITYSEPASIFTEPQDVPSLQRTIERLEHENAQLKDKLAEAASQN